MKNYINGINLEEKHSLVIINAANVFMQMPERKDSVQNDFQDQDGLDIDLAVPKFKARPFSFQCVLTAPTIDEFKRKYFGLFQLLKQGDRYQMYNDELDMKIYIYFLKQTELSSLQRTQNGDYAMTFTLNFYETNPFDNLPIVVLVDDQNRVLVP